MNEYGVADLAGSAWSVFVRDGRSGACSVGAPPDNLGFRLVRDRGRPLPLGLGRLFG